jgi:hypothetical protein
MPRRIIEHPVTRDRLARRPLANGSAVPRTETIEGSLEPGRREAIVTKPSNPRRAAAGETGRRASDDVERTLQDV